MNNQFNPSEAPKICPHRVNPLTAIGAVLVVASFFGSTLAIAQVNASGDTGIDNSGNYRQERAWCMVNTTGEARIDCLKNSGAAQNEKRKGTLDNNGGNFSSNALARCNVFKGDDYAACKARVLGLGTAAGSVQGGGILKQIETVESPNGKDSSAVAPKTPS